MFSFLRGIFGYIVTLVVYISFKGLQQFLRFVKYILSYFPFPHLLDSLNLAGSKLHSSRMRRNDSGRFSSNSLSTLSYEGDCLQENINKLSELCKLDITPHSTRTKDGYHLQMFRCKSRSPKLGRIAVPVLMIHGLMQDCDTYLCAGESHSLASILCEEGYDVWLCNNRGTKYSQKHDNLSPHDEEFWDFCIDDLATFDVPAFIDYVKSETNFSKVCVVGFSQGSAQMLAALSSHGGNLNDSVALFVALAAAMKAKGVQKGIWTDFLHHHSCVALENAFGNHDMIGNAGLWKQILSPSAYSHLISNSMDFLFGWKSHNILKDRRTDLFQHVYSPSSVKIVKHWFQAISHGELKPYVAQSRSTGLYRLFRNLPFHFNNDNEVVSPGNEDFAHYDLNRVACPVAMISGGQDGIVDSLWVQERLSHCLDSSYCVEDYEHLDLIWADDAPERVFCHVVTALEKYRTSLVQ